MVYNFRTLCLFAVLVISVSALARASSDCTCSDGGCTGTGGCQHACCEDCGKTCDPCDLIKCTIMVPTKVLEQRTKVCVTKSMEEREETYTVFEKKPIEREFKKKTCYLDNDVKEQTITEEKCHLVKVPVETTYVVKEYHPEVRDVLTRRTVCVECNDPACEPCRACGVLGCLLDKHHCCVETCVEEINPCEVMVETRGTRETSGTEIRVAVETTKRNIAYCVMVPKEHEELCFKEKTYDIVPVEKKRKVMVCVPKVEKVPVDVVVCKDLPQCIYCCKECAAKHKHSCR